MRIAFDPKTSIFHLTNGKISYVMRLYHQDYLAHLYYGKAIDEPLNAERFFYETEREGAPQPDGLEMPRLFSLDTLPQEYPGFGAGDYRVPALQVTFADGASTVDLRYKGYEILENAPHLQGLPQVRLEGKKSLTLELTLEEVAKSLEVKLYFTILEDLPLIIRYAKFTNLGQEDLRLEKAASLSVDFLEADFELIRLYGAHANERNLERKALSHGIDLISSTRGATSHQHQNFVALVRPETTEFQGEVYATSLLWSGNFAAEVERSSFDNARLVIGLNSFDFAWCLESGESFTTPQAVLVYSDEGLNGMSQTFHSLVSNYIVNENWQRKERPILVNSWEAAYFNFTEESIVRFAKDAVDKGAELIVLDDGWFGKRDKDLCSLGDWTEIALNKLPSGLKGLADKIHGLGAKFGLWVEPEMVSPDSNLFRSHPSWALSVPNHKRSQQRNQYVLDLANKEVRDYIVQSICTVLQSAPIDYVKWDMNRNLTEVGSPVFPAKRQHEIATRYTLGAYEIMERITKAFPHILFESCAGGGRRFDLGLLYYMPQVWTSDNTDAVCRQKIQYGTSLIFPPLTMGSHVSASPNHQVGRATPLLTRFICAASGNFGYEMDLGKLDEKEQEEVKEQIALYKKIRPTIEFGKFYRLISPFEGTLNETSWEFISEDGSEVILMYFKNNSEPSSRLRRVRFKYLEESASYQVVHHLHTKSIGLNEYVKNYNLEGEIFTASQLMFAGLTMDRVDADFASYLIVLHKQN